MNGCDVCGIKSITPEEYVSQWKQHHERVGYNGSVVVLKCDRCKSIRARDPELFDFFIAVLDNKIGKATDDLYEQLREMDNDR